MKRKEHPRARGRAGARAAGAGGSGTARGGPRALDGMYVVCTLTYCVFSVIVIKVKQSPIKFVNGVVMNKVSIKSPPRSACASPPAIVPFSEPRGVDGNIQHTNWLGLCRAAPLAAYQKK